MALGEGFEPTIFGFRHRRSNLLSYPRNQKELRLQLEVASSRNLFPKKELLMRL